MCLTDEMLSGGQEVECLFHCHLAAVSHRRPGSAAVEKVRELVSRILLFVLKRCFAEWLPLFW